MEYKEIFRLKKMLEEANIPFEFTDDLFHIKDKVIKKRGVNYIMLDSFYPAYQIKIYKNGTKEEICDAVQNCISHGNKQDLLEIMGGLTKEEQERDGVVLGYLTAEEVSERFKQCYKNGCSTYKNLEEE